MPKHSRAHVREQRLKHITRKRRLLREQTFIMGYHPWEERAVRMKDRKPCSCWFCCNPRRRGEGDPIATVKRDLEVEPDPVTREYDLLTV